MNIPENGRVVVIDDKIEEGLPLVSSLAKQNIPVIYFSGKKEELPAKPLTGIRIVFLDIVLGTDGQPPKTQVATASRIFKSIIDVNNGPYLLIAWTKHEEHIESIKAELVDRPPLCFLDLEKEGCKDKDGNYDLNKIEGKMKSELNKVEYFHLFTIWENLLHQAASEIVNDFSSFYKIDDNWDKNISSIFFHLAKAYLGKTSDAMENNEIVRNALLTFNGAFIDTLENRIKSNPMTVSSISTGNIPAEICGKINKKILLFLESDIRKPEPGNIYCVTEKLGMKCDLNELFEGGKKQLDCYPKKNDLIPAVRYIFLEGSPSCDYAQKNWRVHRCISGVMWPYEHMDKIKKKAEFMYITPLFEIDGNLYKLVFNLRYLTSIHLEQLNNVKALFRIRRNMLVDIQSFLARHISRPGIVFINE